MSKKYRVKEIFGPTFQGEGTHTGLPVKFLRFAGCNKWSGLEKDRANSICSYCDTNFRDGRAMEIHEIIAALDELGSPDVNRLVISGGEPTLQIDADLCAALREEGYHLHLETNGSREIDDLYPYFEHVTCSPKQSFAETKLTRAHDLKFLYPWISPEIQPREFHRFIAKNYYIQPVEREGAFNEHIPAILEYCAERPWFKLSLQTHKITGVK